MRKTPLLLALLALLAATAPSALAARPQLGTSWSGGNGRGLPMGFTLNKKGKATAAFTGYTCKGKSGVGNAASSKPAGKLTADNKLTIVFKSRGLTVTMKISFPTRKSAKGTITFKSPTCTAPKIKFTAKPGVES